MARITLMVVADEEAPLVPGEEVDAMAEETEDSFDVHNCVRFLSGTCDSQRACIVRESIHWSILSLLLLLFKLFLRSDNLDN